MSKINLKKVFLKVTIHLGFWVSIYILTVYQNLNAPFIHHLYFLRDLII